MKTIQFHYVAFKYAETQPDGHWFDKETLRFFKSRLPKVAYETDAGRFFITSEADPSGERRYTVREQLHNGNIDTVGPFHVWKTQAIAKAKLTEVASAKWWTESLGRIELRIPLELARTCCHPGDCEADVLAAREHWLIVDQLARLVPSTVAEALKEYGAWSDEELADHDQNLTRLLWLACSDVAEENKRLQSSTLDHERKLIMTTQTIKAWLTYPQGAEPGDECNPEKLTFTNHNMADVGWLEVGYAEITLTTTFSREQLVQSMVSTLQEQIRKERAESHQRISEFERKINDLLLITHEAQS